MADVSAPVLKAARGLAITHILVGVLMLPFTIAFRVLFSNSTVDSRYKKYRLDLTRYCGIWISIWICVTGGLSIVASRKGRGVIWVLFMVSVNISILLSAVATSLYTSQFVLLLVIAVGFKQFILCVVVAILAWTAFVIGIAASIMSCMMSGSFICCGGIPNQQEQVMVYHSGAVGIVPSQGSYVVPVAIPGQEGCEMVTVNTSRDEEHQCSWV